MSHWTPGIPEPGEYPAYAVRYVELIETPDVIHALKTQLPKTLALLEGVDEARAGEFRYQPGKWTFKEVLGHLIDCERVFSYRTLRIARADATPLPPFEQDDYIAPGQFNERTLAGLIEEFEAVRHSTVTLLEGLPRGAWMNRGTVSGQSATARGIAFVTAGHEAYHQRILKERYLAD